MKEELEKDLVELREQPMANAEAIERIEAKIAKLFTN